MKSYQEYLAENNLINEAAAKKTTVAKKKEAAKKDKSSNRIKCIQEIVDELKSTFKNYDLFTRKFVWEKLNSSKGKDLIHKIIQNPTSYLSKSPFTQLVTGDEK
jgi:hypothetical protein